MIHFVKEAKDNLSEIIRLAESGKPQIILRDDTEVAVVVSIHDWKRPRGQRQSWSRFCEIVRLSVWISIFHAWRTTRVESIWESSGWRICIQAFI